MSARSEYRAEIQQAKKAILAYLQTWPTERIIEAYSFNQDGKMQYSDTCGCIRGVASAKILHNRADGPHYCIEDGHVIGEHYYRANSDAAIVAEAGYQRIGHRYGRDMPTFEVRQRRMQTLFRIEIARRERAERRLELHDITSELHSQYS